MTTIVDPFTQADGNAANFTSLLGNTIPHVTSNAVDAPVAGTLYAALHNTTLLPNMIVQITGSVSNGSIAIISRADASGNGIQFDQDAATWFLSRLDAGVGTQLATGSITTAQHVIKLASIGNIHKAYIDGIEVASVTDATYNTNTHIGLIVQRTAGTLTADDLLATDELWRPPLLVPGGAVLRASRW